MQFPVLLRIVMQSWRSTGCLWKEEKLAVRPVVLVILLIGKPCVPENWRHQTPSFFFHSSCRPKGTLVLLLSYVWYLLLSVCDIPVFFFFTFWLSFNNLYCIILQPLSWNDCWRVALPILIPFCKSHQYYASPIRFLGNAILELFFNVVEEA